MSLKHLVGTLNNNATKLFEKIAYELWSSQYRKLYYFDIDI